MATRSLTEIFFFMRNNAVKNRHSYGYGNSASPDEEMGLVNCDVNDESQVNGVDLISSSWLDKIEEVRYEMSKIKGKVKELSALHDKHLNRPTLDDSTDEERAIDCLTTEITKLFQRCRGLVQQVASSKCYTAQEQKLAKNASSSAASELQTVSSAFRQSQSNYLTLMKTREERAGSYFEEPSYRSGTEDLDLDSGFAAEHTQLLLDENTAQVEQRQREIENVVRSINDLNVVFRDLAAMVADQGTVLDRIDFNVEQASVKVEAGHQQLVKAETYQKGNRKMLAILLLAGLVILLLIILLAVKLR